MVVRLQHEEFRQSQLETFTDRISSNGPKRIELVMAYGIHENKIDNSVSKMNGKIALKSIFKAIVI